MSDLRTKFETLADKANVPQFVAPGTKISVIWVNEKGEIEKVVAYIKSGKKGVFTRSFLFGWNISKMLLRKGENHGYTPESMIVTGC